MNTQSTGDFKAPAEAVENSFPASSRHTAAPSNWKPRLKSVVHDAGKLFHIIYTLDMCLSLRQRSFLGAGISEDPLEMVLLAQKELIRAYVLFFKKKPTAYLCCFLNNKHIVLHGHSDSTLNTEDSRLVRYFSILLSRSG